MSDTEENDALERVWSLADAGDHGAALAEADRLIATRPDLSEAHTARGWALENLGPGRLPEAREAYLEALRLGPDDLWAKEGLSTVLRRLDRPAEADALCAEVVEAARRRDASADVLEVRGWCEYRLGRLEDAEAALREALTLEPTSVSVRLDLGLVLLCEGRTEEALAAYASGADEARRSGRMAGVVAVALDDLDEALAERETLRRDPAAERARGLLRGVAGTGAGPSSPWNALPMGST